MSHSIHQTNKSVLGGKSKTEIQSLVEHDDADLQALVQKKTFKRKMRLKRASAARPEKPSERYPTGIEVNPEP